MVWSFLTLADPIYEALPTEGLYEVQVAVGQWHHSTLNPQ
jgi:hypothetical protein